MSDNPESGKSFDPLEAWKNMRDASLEAWAKVMTEWVNTPAYAQATGATLDTYLSASAPFREALQKSMVLALQQLGLPTRADFESLAERMTNLEMRLDDMDAKLDQLAQPRAAKSKPKKAKSA
jgi:polyhydroxyalkanoic acid synthase PhaR subunit